MVKPEIVSLGPRMTGMRLWISATSALGVVVMMEQDSTVLPSGAVQQSHRPAKANTELSAIVKQYGVFVLPVFAHS